MHLRAQLESKKKKKKYKKNTSIILWLKVGYSEKWPKPFTDSKIHGVNMGPIWGRQVPGGPHVSPMNLAIRVAADALAFRRRIMKKHLKMSSTKWQIFFSRSLFVRRAGLLWSQQDFEWRWSVPLFKCLTVLEFSFILFDLCLLITFFNFIMNYVPIVTFWIFTYHKISILSVMFCFIWSYWIIYFLACLEVSWRVVS